MAPLTAWPVAPAFLKLAAPEVHVWQAGLDFEPGVLAQLHTTLAGDEQARAARFHFQKDQNHYIAARGILRSILGRYLLLEPGQIAFEYNSHGKPALIRDLNGADLRFNVSHSHGLALFAFNLGRDIGVDVESLRPDFATDEIAARFFAPQEVAVLSSIANPDRARAFFNCWTRKEAFVKARGVGISLGLDQFVVSLAPGEPAALLHANDDAEAAKRWMIREFDVGPEFAAALAVEGTGLELRCWSISLP